MSSYCVPFIDRMEVLYTNGIIHFNAGQLQVSGPRDTFDQKGFFTQPPLIYEDKLDPDTIYLESLAESCRYFFDCLDNARPIEMKYFEQSLLSNRVCLAVADKDAVKII